MVLVWYTVEVEKSDIRLCKQVSDSFTVTGWAGMAFIRYQRCLLLKTKGITN